MENAQNSTINIISILLDHIECHDRQDEEKTK